MKYLFTSLLFCCFAYLQAQDFTHHCSHRTQNLRETNASQRLNFSLSLYNQMQDYDVKHYFINLNSEAASTALSGSVTITAEVTASSLTTFAFELNRNFTISSVEINSTSYTNIDTQNNERRVNIASLPQGTRFTAKINYSGNAPVNPSNLDSGFWAQSGYTFTLCEPYGSADWMPVKQILEDKAEEGADVYITTSSTNKVATLGLLKNTVNVGGGKTRYEYESDYPIAYYLISYAVGEFVEYNLSANPTGASQPIPIQNFARSSSELSGNQSNLDETVYQLELFSDLFGLYPFHEEKYGQVRLPAPFSLENQMMSAMATYGRSTIAHELAHQWYGNSVALKSFSHIWLNEGFATYSEYLYTEYRTSKAAANGQLQSWINNITNVAGGRVYVSDSLNTDDIFNTRLSYLKGGVILHMMRYMVSDDTEFYDAMEDYYNTFRDSNVDTWDLAQSFQNSTGINFTTFMNQWVYGEGYPNYNITWNWVGGKLYILVNQSTSTTTTSFFRMPLEFELTDVNGLKKVIRVEQTQNIQTFTLDEGVSINSVAFDPNLGLLARTKNIARDNGLNPGLSAPQLENLVPANNASLVPVNTTLRASFNKPVVRGTGNILIKKLADNSLVQSIDVAGANATIESNNTLLLTLLSDLDFDISYYVEIPSTAIKDNNDAFFAGFTGNSTWRFQTASEADRQAPQLVSLSPSHEQGGVALSRTFTMTFDEAVFKGTGDVLIRKVDDNSTIQTINMSSGNIFVVDNQVRITPTSPLEYEQTYYIVIPRTAIQDAAGNFYDGFNTPDGWSFTTEKLPLTTSIDNLNQQNYHVYPNPIQNAWLTIELPQNLTYFKGKVEIVDAVGKVRLVNNISTNDNKIDVSGLPKGLYWLRLLTNDSVQTFKIVKH